MVSSEKAPASTRPPFGDRFVQIVDYADSTGQDSDFVVHSANLILADMGIGPYATPEDYTLEGQPEEN